MSYLPKSRAETIGLCAGLESHLIEIWPSCLLAQVSKVNTHVFQKAFEKI